MIQLWKLFPDLGSNNLLYNVDKYEILHFVIASIFNC